jgi:CheY-like chemotaxis protein
MVFDPAFIRTYFYLSTVPLIQENLIDVLLIEDDFFDRTLTVRGLRRYGMYNPVHSCERAEQALRLLKANPAIGLILLDLSLPGMTGVEFLSIVRSNQETAAIPVIVLTGSSSELDAERCRRLRADGYLVKPIVFAKVAELAKMLGLRWALLPAKATA